MDEAPDLPTWTDLTDDERSLLLKYASSFGIGLSDDHPRSEDAIWPNESESLSFALEMFTLSRAILLRKRRPVNDTDLERIIHEIAETKFPSA